MTIFKISKSYGLTDWKHFVNKEVLALSINIIYNSFVCFNIFYYYDLFYSNSFFLHTAKVGRIRGTAIPKISISYVCWSWKIGVFVGFGFYSQIIG